MLQKVILDQFVSKFKNPTYKEMVSLTGIEQTRLFRIKNGAEMKVSELEVFLDALSGENSSLELFMDCYKFLDVESVFEVERLIKRKITLAKLQRSA